MSTLRSRRIQMLGLLSISSGMPLGFVFNTLQIFLREASIDLRTIGLIGSASLPWTLKFLWAPLLDRYALSRPDRRRSWVLLAQAGLALLMAAFAAYTANSLLPGPPGQQVLAGDRVGVIGCLVFAMALLGATQDIALDAYAVELLQADEVGPASGLRVLWYRVGMLISGALAVFLAEYCGWPAVFGGMSLVFALLSGITLAAAPLGAPAIRPPSLREAITRPICDFLERPQAFSIALFLVLYKFGDNLGGSMVNPFLKDLCFSNAEIGMAVKTLGTLATLGGAGLGATFMARSGLGRALWIFGLAQAAGNLLYACVATTHLGPVHVALCGTSPISSVTRLTTYVAIVGEYASQGMGTAALVALVTKLSDRRYSVAQYALLSSLFGFGRWLAGPPSGWLAQGLGYPAFFVLATLAAIPGLLLVRRMAFVCQVESAVQVTNR